MTIRAEGHKVGHYELARWDPLAFAHGQSTSTAWTAWLHRCESVVVSLELAALKD